MDWLFCKQQLIARPARLQLDVSPSQADFSFEYFRKKLLKCELQIGGGPLQPQIKHHVAQQTRLFWDLKEQQSCPVSSFCSLFKPF